MHAILFHAGRWRQLYNKTRSLRRGFVSQVSLERPHERARKVQAKAGSPGLFLKRPEEEIRIRHAAPGIAHAHDNFLFLDAGGDGELSLHLAQQRALTILDQVEENLHQTLAVCPYGWDIRCDVPMRMDSMFA